MPLIKEAVSDILQRNDHNISEHTLSEVVAAVMDCNVPSTSTSEGAELGSSKRRKTFIERTYPCLLPVEYQLGQPGHTSMYVPILSVIQELFKNTDILNKMTEPNTTNRQYASCSDGSHFLENELLSTGNLVPPLQLYIDEFEIANPLGTSCKIHNVCAVYWVLANVPPKYQSALHAIQLAILVKAVDLHKYGYAAVLAPLLRDVNALEQDGVSIERVGLNVRGNVFCVSADNLAAHGLGGFVESFRAGHVCRGSVEQFQVIEVRERRFPQRTKASHDLQVQTVHGSDTLSSHFGVKDGCVLRESLNYFHTITGFPPDILHDLLEGLVPVEISLCVKEMIRLKNFTLKHLNHKITSFSYQHADKVNRPQAFPKTFLTRGTIGGNGHENATLL